jgi:hypothetical protein
MLAGCGSAVAQQPRILDVDKLSESERDAAAALDVMVSGPISVTANTFKTAAEKQARIDELVRRYAGQVRHRLATLYYPVDLSGTQAEINDPRLAEQVRLFESTLNPFDSARGVNPAVKVDGVLSFFEYDELARLARAENLIQVDLGGGKEIMLWKIGSGGERLAGASGTWVLEGETIGFPVNLAEIRCSSLDGTCTLKDTSVSLDELNGNWDVTIWDHPWRDSNYHVTSDETTFTITRWTQNVVEARADLGGPTTQGCRFAILSINFDTKSVSQIVQDGDTACESFAGQAAPRLGRPRIASLRPTGPTLNAYYRKRFDEVSKHYGPLAKQFSWERQYIVGD